MPTTRSFQLCRYENPPPYPRLASKILLQALETSLNRQIPFFGTMEDSKIVPTKRELERFNLANADTVDLIRQAQQADAADRQLTVWEAVKKYKKAVAWSCLLSTALVMEGYDVVIVRPPASFHFPSYFPKM